MRAQRWMMVAGFALCASAQAGEEGDLSSRSRASAAKSLEVAPGAAPFAAHADSLPSLAWHPSVATPERAAVPCADGFAAVCFDARNRGLTYRGARDYMPRVDGLTAEGVALRHDRVILRYSFK